MLTYDMVYNAYHAVLREQGTVSCTRIGKYLAGQGNANPKTGKPFSRQSIRLVLARTPEGRALLDRKIATMERTPIIVDDRPGILDWLRAHGMGTVRVYKPSEATVDLIKGRAVYGNPPLAAAMVANCIYTVGVQGTPVVKDTSRRELEQLGAMLMPLTVHRVR